MTAVVVETIVKREGQQDCPCREEEGGSSHGRGPGRFAERPPPAHLLSPTLVGQAAPPPGDAAPHRQQCPAGIETPATLEGTVAAPPGVAKGGAPPVPPGTGR